MILAHCAPPPPPKVFLTPSHNFIFLVLVLYVPGHILGVLEACSGCPQFSATLDGDQSAKKRIQYQLNFMNVSNQAQDTEPCRLTGIFSDRGGQ